MRQKDCVVLKVSKLCVYKICIYDCYMSGSEPACEITQMPVIYEDNNVYTLQ
jgi:hypothetical protein